MSAITDILKTLLSLVIIGLLVWFSYSQISKIIATSKKRKAEKEKAKFDAELESADKNPTESKKKGD